MIVNLIINYLDRCIFFANVIGKVMVKLLCVLYHQKTIKF